MTALSTWTIDAGVVRRIRSIFNDTVPAPQPADKPRKATSEHETGPGPLSHDELPQPGDRPVPIHAWRRFYVVLQRVLEPFPNAWFNLAEAVNADPLLREEALR